MNDSVAKIVDWYFTRGIRGYLGNLTFLKTAVDNDWLPAEGDPTVEAHLAALSQHLRNSGQPTVDPFLLRYGLTVSGMQRGIIPPLMVLDANRGGLSNRRIKEAEGQITRLIEVLAIGRCVYPDLSDDTKLALAQLTERTSKSTPLDDDFPISIIAAMSEQTTAAVIDRALSLAIYDVKPLRDLGNEMLQAIACFRDRPLSDAICEELLRHDLLWPPVLFHDAGTNVAKELLARIESAPQPSEQKHLFMGALAWTRSAVAVDAFYRWKLSTPRTDVIAHMAVDFHPVSAGWCFDETGRHHSVISERCSRMRLCDDGRPAKSGVTIPCRVRLKRRCRDCRANLYCLFDCSELRDSYLVGEFAGAPRRVLTCLNCAVFGTTYTEYGKPSREQWPSSDNPAEEIAYEPSRCERVIEDAAISPFAFTEPFIVNDVSTLGGIPTWLQNHAHPHCPCCSRRMTFLAQHDNGPLGEEGIFYAFFCRSCCVSAVLYQQT